MCFTVYHFDDQNFKMDLYVSHFMSLVGCVY
jgi:hypothetical protein